MEGVVRTRVGYTGGKKKNPTYHALGQHTEAIQIDYNPDKISYEDLLKVFWKSHNPCRSSYSRQYMSAIFYGSEDQKKEALATMKKEEKKRGQAIRTEILPLEKFYRAEDYHQKYRLRQHKDFSQAIHSYYKSEKGFVDSTAAARLNGYLAGHGKWEEIKETAPQLGLSQNLHKKLLQKTKKGLRK